MRSLRLLPDWKRVLRKAWSVKFNLISSVVGGVAAALPAFADRIPPTWFLSLCAVLPLAALAFRLLDQSEPEQ